MNSRIGKILSCVLQENKDDFSSLIREEIKERIKFNRKKQIPDMIEKVIFPPKDQQTLNINESQYENSVKFIPILNELAGKKGNISVIFSDNSETTVKPNEAENLIQLHDSLNEENQIKLRSSLIHSKESFKNFANFAEKYTKRKG
jgi:hypothetical protein|tara:strand:+ start:1341 stop:1778 length:438 start_codon:yes stop_codon:yes gene_type:complete